MVQQAQANLAPHSRIVRLIVDRAYVDGASLYELATLGITFVVIAKAGMVAREAALAEQDASPIYERLEQRRHGQGRDQWAEPLLSRVRVVQGLRHWDAYRPPVVPGQRLSWEQRPTLNAVVVSLWRNQAPDPVDGPRVYLTNGPVDDPWLTADAYDDRSWIENGLFRNSKQFWTLTRWFPKRTAEGVRSHLTFVVLLLAVATAYRLWSKAQAGAVPQPPASLISTVQQQVRDATTGAVSTPATVAPPRPTHLASPVAPPPAADAALAPFLAHNLLGGQGALRWRRQLVRDSRDQVLVLVGRQYGIFDIHELLVLVGFRSATCRPTSAPPRTSCAVTVAPMILD